MDSFGFIITRHVNSIKTNKYWNNNVRLIRRFYPLTKIVIIDDNSNYDYIRDEYNKTNNIDDNIIIIQSEYPKRGELLPYYYYLKFHFFENAVIIHDSVFINRKFNFNKLNGIKVIPLWHFEKDNENIDNTLRLLKYLKNYRLLEDKLIIDKIMSINKNRNWYGCFGVQSYINLQFLQYIEYKYNITNLINGVNCRADRCCLERILGCIFCTENQNLLLQSSLFGNISTYMSNSFSYSYEQYLDDFNKGKLPKSVIKVWTGR